MTVSLSSIRPSDAAVAADRERRRAQRRRCGPSPRCSSAGTGPSSSAAIASTAPFRTSVAVGRPDAAGAGLGAERDLLGDRRGEGREARPRRRCRRAPELGRAARGRARRSSGPPGVSSRIEATQRGRDGSASATPGAARDRRREPVAVGDRAGLVEQDHVDVARRLDRAAAHGQDVEPRDAVHAGDADRRQEAADRGRDQADEQRDQRDGVDGRARRSAPNGRSVTVAIRKTIVRPGEQDRQRDLVRRALALGALDEGDHPVEERLARDRR